MESGHGDASFNTVIKPKEFYVSEVRAQRGGPPLVIGVPNNGIPIRIGDVFRTTYRTALTQADILAEIPRPPPTDLAEIALTVVSISYPRESINELPAGHAGALALAGDGLKLITKGYLLST